MMEARVGIEPTHKGFADLSLTTWVPRLSTPNVSRSAHKIQWQHDANSWRKSRGRMWRTAQQRNPPSGRSSAVNCGGR